MRMISANFIATSWNEYEQQGPEYIAVAKWWRDNADSLFGKLGYDASFNSWKRWYKDMRSNEWNGEDKGPVEALAFLKSLHSSIGGSRFRPISKVKNWLSGLRDNDKDSKIEKSTLNVSDLEKAQHILHYYPKFGQLLSEEIVRVANVIGANPYHLANLINFESGGSTSVYNKLGSGAVGLIQFMPKTAKGLGTTTDELANMDVIEQMQYVERYLKQFGTNLNTEQKLYMAVFFPRWMNKDIDEPFPQWAFDKNPGIKTPRDYIKMVNAGARIKTAKAISFNNKNASVFVAKDWDEYISQGNEYNKVYQWWLKNSSMIPPMGTFSQNYDDWKRWYGQNRILWGKDKDPNEVLPILNDIISKKNPIVTNTKKDPSHEQSDISDLMILGDSQAGGIGAALSRSKPLLVYQNGASIKTVEKLFLNYIANNRDNFDNIKTIFIQAGGNDIWSLSLEQMKAAMLSLINSILSANQSVKIIVGTITPRESVILQKHKSVQESYRQKLINFNLWLTTTLPSTSNNVSIFNSNSLMSDPKNPLMQHSQYASEDGVHFNARGYKYLASNIMEQIG